jgi:signal transduction histidine kinase
VALTVARWSLAVRLRVALAGVLLLLVVAGLAIVLALRQADHAMREQSQRAYPARIAASQLLTSLVDQETGLRGYALTRDKTFLSPYREGLVKEQRARQELEALIPAGDSSRLALLTVDAAITAWRDQYASFRTELLEEGDPVATIAFGRELFEKVRASSAALDAQLARRIEDTQEEARRDRRLVLVVLAGMGLALLGAVVALQRALQVSVLRPMTQLRHQVADVSGGSHDVPIEPTGPPDLQLVSRGVESMRRELVGALAAVEEQRQVVELRAAELARSNADLEQFAYVASHDLQEPLRKVASFCQLLEQRYGEELDERGKQYIAFAVDGAKRMQRLITDLLTFSRVGRTSEGFAPVDLAPLVTRTWNGLQGRVDETGGSLETDLEDGVLVEGDEALMQMLLTNLVSNSLKYHRDDAAPRVCVSARRVGDQVLLSVADNGIGIPDEYAEKVFVIFQRLHGRDEYEGTGIGLALVKKIVEFHGGHVSLAPSPLGGTCVQCALPSAGAAGTAPGSAVAAALPDVHERSAGV